MSPPNEVRPVTKNEDITLVGSLLDQNSETAMQQYQEMTGTNLRQGSPTLPQHTHEVFAAGDDIGLAPPAAPCLRPLSPPLHVPPPITCVWTSYGSDRPPRSH
jgi:hypothetical protein